MSGDTGDEGGESDAGRPADSGDAAARGDDGHDGGAEPGTTEHRQRNGTPSSDGSDPGGETATPPSGREEALDPLLLAPDSDEAARALDALGSESTREVLWLLYERPRTAQDVAAATDCSVQNAHYHLRKLASADLAEVVGTRFPDGGNHRDVYGPTSDPLVLAGTDETAADVTDLLDRLLAGGLVVVGLLSAAVGADRLTGAPRPPPPSGPASVDGGGLLATVDPVLVVVVAGVVALLAFAGAGRLLLRG